MTEPSAFEEVAGELAHLEQEAEVAALGSVAGAGALENLDNALRTLVVHHRGENEQEVGRVGCGVFVVIGCVAGAGVRGDERAFGCIESLMQQAAVLLLADLILDEASLL